MKRFLLALLAIALFVTPGFCVDPEEQNAGFLDIDQHAIDFGMLSNGIDNATATFCGW